MGVLLMIRRSRYFFFLKDRNRLRVRGGEKGGMWRREEMYIFCGMEWGEFKDVQDE